MCPNAVAAVGGLLKVVPSAERRLREFKGTRPSPARRSITIRDSELRAAGLHLASSQHKLAWSTIPAGPSPIRRG